jgi:Holliday junction DNA helicase RuvA
MIAFIEGILVEHAADGVVVNVNGVGYFLATTRVKSEIGDKVRFFVSEVIREDKFDLYGFETKDEKELFLILTGVQGVGPKLGQKILAAASPDSLRKHIQTGDVSFFTSISGVGKKTAQKIILDLKGVLVSESEEVTEEGNDIVEALESLGYRKEDISKVMKHVTGETIEAKVKSALKMLSR